MRLVQTTTAGLLAVGTAALPSARSDCKATTQWPGWKGVKYAFIFGDSYTSTGFNYTLAPPSPGNPLGNPPYPGYTSANGANWVDALTTRHNSSAVQTYNLAYGGATVDSALVAPWKPTVLSLKDQVDDEFLPGYAGAKPSAAAPVPHWAGSDTLFAVWIGINDVGNSHYRNDTATLNHDILAVYSRLVTSLVDAGARNLLFLNVPPVDRSPLTSGQGPTAQASEKADIAAFNGLVEGLAKSVKTTDKGKDANVWFFDVNTLFGQVLDDPSKFTETAGYKNVTAFCDDYQNGTPAPDTFNPKCGIPVNQYFWLNSLHPTYPVHDLIAKKVAEALVAGPNIC